MYCCPSLLFSVAKATTIVCTFNFCRFQFENDKSKVKHYLYLYYIYLIFLVKLLFVFICTHVDLVIEMSIFHVPAPTFRIPYEGTNYWRPAVPAVLGLHVSLLSLDTCLLVMTRDLWFHFLSSPAV